MLLLSDWVYAKYLANSMGIRNGYCSDNIRHPRFLVGLDIQFQQLVPQPAARPAEAQKILLLRFVRIEFEPIGFGDGLQGNFMA